MDTEKDDIIKRQANSIIRLTIIIILLLATILFLILCDPMPKECGNCGTKNKPVGLCGNAFTDENGSANAKKLGLSGGFKKGKIVFKQNCAVCHTITDAMLTGPGLKGIYDRVPEPKEKWLVNYILNYKKVIASGDPYAIALNKDSTIEMSIFEGVLSEEEVKDVVAYMVGVTQ